METEQEQEQEKGKSEQKVEQRRVNDKSKLEQFEDPDEGLSDEETAKKVSLPDSDRTPLEDCQTDD